MVYLGLYCPVSVTEDNGQRPWGETWYLSETFPRMSEGVSRYRRLIHRAIESPVSKQMKPDDQNFVSRSSVRAEYRISEGLAHDP